MLKEQSLAATDVWNVSCILFGLGWRQVFRYGRFEKFNMADDHRACNLAGLAFKGLKMPGWQNKSVS